MSAEPLKKLFNVDDYHRMESAGILSPEDRVELIDGEIIELSPVGKIHRARVMRITKILMFALNDKANVSIQSPLRLNDASEPEPDVVVFKHREDCYEAEYESPGDVLLVVEISDSSLAYDRNVKSNLYARSEILEYWVEDVTNKTLIVHREPREGTYRNVSTLRQGESLSPLAFPDVVIALDDLLGK